MGKKVRRNGIGKRFVNEIMKWGRVQGFTGILLEVEAELTATNKERIQFWKKCGFIETAYIHHYKVVPERYKALYIPFYERTKIPDKEKDFFLLLSHFHQKSFRGANQL